MASDPYFSSTKLILNGDYTTIADRSAAAQTISQSSISPVTVSNVQSKFGGGSMLLPGITQNTYLGFGSSTIWKLSAPLTIEFWIYINAYNSNGARVLSAGGGTVAWNSTTGIHWLFQITSNGVAFSYITSGWTANGVSITCSLSTWTHVAVTFDGTTIRMFKNGVLTSSSNTAPGVPSGTPNGHLGAINGEGGTASTYAANVYIDDIRITSVCRAISDFPVPTSANQDGAFAIEGIVYDDTASPCSRTVRAYARDTGEFLSKTISDPITGRYTLWTTRNTPCTVVFFDDDVGVSYNALVLDRVSPQT